MKELEGKLFSALGIPQALYALLLTLPLLAACASKERTPPPYEANPSPKEAYEVVITTHDAPEDMFLSTVAVGYVIADESCLPPIDNFEGVRYGIEKHLLTIPFRKIAPDKYVGTYFRDGMASKDYFGHGVCSWDVQYVGASLKTRRTESFTYFSISTTPEKKKVTRYNSKEIRPLLDDGQIYPASDFSESRFEKEISATDRSKFFSYSISIITRKDEE
ncbi:hypothetical protein [Stenotrophomonas sp. SAU14A_NAIMI4_5]|uniref:hypothetical protein n=1 Tax=Stenotrophomonas sp. SAU14A_NAIMI4_5 TaxID=2072413 RepID=UPI00131F0CC7|nr:hypothetical protein [Stenotrophomonas sp. SAU14A_NAIMI4_5]